jgi:primosomal protein N''
MAGRPRLYTNQADKQAEYRRRKEEKEFENRQLAMRAQDVIKAARARGIGDETTPAWKVLELVAHRLT